MRRGTALLVLACLIGLVALAVWLYGKRQPRQQPQPLVDRRPDLRRLLAEQESESAQAVAKYRPKTQARIDDLDNSAADILRGLPSVVQVEVLVKVEKPTCRIIHLRDWHFVPKELVSIDMAEAHGRPLSQDEIDLLYEQHLLEIELVQIEQMVLLRCLIQHHGLERVYSEGFSPGELENYKEKIAVLRAMEKEQIPQLRSQLADVRRLAEGAAGDRRVKAHVIEAELVAMLDGHKHRLLEIGASGRLLMAGELEDVLPLEDAAALERAKPITPEGKVRLDPENLKARRDAQVKSVLEQGAFGLIVLGGAHDLSDNVRRLGEGRCEYIRVTTRRFKEVSE